MSTTRRCIRATAATVVAAGGVMFFPGGGGGAEGAVVIGPVASTTLKNQAGAAVGTVTFQQLSNGRVTVRATISGLGPASDFHGFHIHTNGDCSGDFSAAGGHWNPTGTTHGDHTGDMPVQFAAGDGVARSNFTTDAFTVDQLLADPGGVAVIVHAGRDNYGNVPTRYSPDGGTTSGPDATTNSTGDAGARSVCGVIGTGLTPMGTGGGAAGPGRRPATAGSSAGATQASSAARAAPRSTRRWSAWPPPRAASATTWPWATAASSPTATPASPAAWAASRSPSRWSASPPRRATPGPCCATRPARPPATSRSPRSATGCGPARSSRASPRRRSSTGSTCTPTATAAATSPPPAATGTPAA